MLWEIGRKVGRLTWVYLHLKSSAKVSEGAARERSAYSVKVRYGPDGLTALFFRH